MDISVSFVYNTI